MNVQSSHYQQAFFKLHAADKQPQLPHKTNKINNHSLKLVQQWAEIKISEDTLTWFWRQESNRGWLKQSLICAELTKSLWLGPKL